MKEGQSAGSLTESSHVDQYPVDVAGGFSRMRLGEILVAMGLLKSRDRDLALERQSKRGLLFGETCRRLKMISASDLNQALALQFGNLNPLTPSVRFGADLVTVSHPNGTYADTVRALSARLMSRCLAEGRKVLGVASAEAGDGRSHIAANLAVCLAQAGWKTLLVDADLRNPKQHQTFGVSQHPGLSRLLCGFTPEDVVRQVPYFKNFSLITAGPLPPNPSDLLGRGELSALIEKAKGYYDIVLLDTPPAARFPDAEMIASAVDTVLVIVRKNRTRLSKTRDFAEVLSENGVHIIGTLVNT
ncbi:polysaccharide biosynthesis tyrosine autokinase [Thiocystis violacea]|uniref:polysaccharide biosynthesis tyrosine autokinase n=1 Tax=Thiocystis violacea TaxID=13725 RepID=UPI001904BA85|nr:polysaccharide biosynthesis tyrosine autokinase [Thiocystis violacea]